MNGEAPTLAALNRRAALASIAVALLLVVLKLWAVWRTNSTAMLGSLADTGLDLVASLATLTGVWIAAMPADREHRFGHGKAEAVAAMVQVVLIALSAGAVALRAVLELLEGGRTAEAESGIAVSLIAMAATLALLAYQRRVLRQTGSLAIATDHLHYKSDLVLNLAVIAALALDRWANVPGVDPLFALAIAVWLAWGAWRAFGSAVEQLMDREWPEQMRQRLIEVVARNPKLRGVHDLRTRTSGHRDFVQFHAAVDGAMTVREAHRVLDEIEDEIAGEFPGVEVLIHTDPEGLIDEEGHAAEELLPRRRQRTVAWRREQA